MQKSWIRNYCSRRNNKIKCDVCIDNVYFCNIIYAKVHLFRVHNIDKDQIDEVDRSSIIWLYFTEDEKYSPKCKICDETIVNGYNEYNLEIHLLKVHPLVIKRLRRTLNACLFEHFELDLPHEKIKCRYCDRMFDKFKLHNITKHLEVHYVNKEAINSIKNNITTIENYLTINNSLTEESNVDSASHQSDDTDL